MGAKEIEDRCLERKYQRKGLNKMKHTTSRKNKKVKKMGDRYSLLLAKEIERAFKEVLHTNSKRKVGKWEV